jgi:hypothetical protein
MIETDSYYMTPASPYFNENKHFYVCSFGGCGSTMLFKYLSNFGKTYHIHSRYPPNELEYVGKENTTKDIIKEWFNGEKIQKENLENYKVIYIYRNPVSAIYSSFINTDYPGYIGACREHLRHIECKNNGDIYLSMITTQNKDLYEIESFYDNYTNEKIKRNYNIICVKYETLFDNISEFNKYVSIEDVKELYPIKKEKNRPKYFYEYLTLLYKNLICKMDKKLPIEII